jgi:hypothetical protein
LAEKLLMLLLVVAALHMQLKALVVLRVGQKLVAMARNQMPPAKPLLHLARVLQTLAQVVVARCQA